MENVLLLDLLRNKWCIDACENNPIIRWRKYNMRLNVLGWTSLQFFDHTYGNSTSFLHLRQKSFQTITHSIPNIGHTHSRKKWHLRILHRKNLSVACVVIILKHKIRAPKLNHFFYFLLKRIVTWVVQQCLLWKCL